MLQSKPNWQQASPGRKGLWISGWATHDLQKDSLFWIWTTSLLQVGDQGPFMTNQHEACDPVTFQ